MPAGNVCEQCGKPQVTLDPKTGAEIDAKMVHFASNGLYSSPEDMMSFHLDCLPKRLEDALRPRHGSAIDAAKAGTRGAELHAVPDDVSDGFDADDPEQFASFVAQTDSTRSDFTADQVGV